MLKLSFSEQVKILLKRRGWTVETLANKLDMSKQNLNQQINRDNFPCKTMEKIAEALDCDLNIELQERTTPAGE